MAFKIGNQVVIQDIDATAAIETNSNLDKLQINGTDVLTHDGSSITLKNVNIDDLMESSINTDNVTEGFTNLFHTTARVEQIINANNQTLNFSDPLLTISNGNTVNLSSLSTDLTGYATEVYVDQAEYDARSYTDQREIGITSAYRSYADQAELDAISTATSQASLDATNKANSAKSQAVSQASADATSKANAARSGAESYTDTEIATVLPLAGGTLTGALTLSGAPSSANNAATKAYVDSAISGGTGALDTDDISEASNLYYTDARVNTLLGTKSYATETYADTAEADAIAAASLDATTKADAAEVDAKAYTDTRETAITTAYQTYADTAEADAISTASSDATTKANQALVDAKAYTDTEVAAIVDGAPGTLDTLNELAAALGDDANLSTTLSTQIGTKLATADFNSTADAWLGSNLYYTDERVDDRVSNLLVAGSNITLTYNDSLNTMTIASATTASGGYDLSSNTTDDVTEGANNLYFTSARVDTILGTKGYATETYADTQVGTKVSKSGDTMTGMLTITPTSGTYGLINNYASALHGGITAPTIGVHSPGSTAFKINGHPNNTSMLFDTPNNIFEINNFGSTVLKIDANNQILNTSGSSPSQSNSLVTKSYVDNAIPTNNNQLTNGAGYITSFTDTNTTYTAGTGLNLVGTTFNNTAPDQTVSLTGSGATSISGTYPNFTISSTDTNTDTNTTYTAGNGLTLTSTEFKMSGSYTGDFTASGDVTAYSDERLKSNITTIEDALNKVKAMRGVMFDKTNSLTGELRQSTGVIAQETEEVLPEVVHNDDNTGYKSVAYGNIVGVLIEAIKEQQLQIDELTEQVEFLKGKR